jgi:MFS family permease
MGHEPMTEQPANEPPVSSSRSAKLIVFLVVFIDLLGFGIVLPLLPLYATELLEPLFPNTSSVVRGGILGALMSLFSLMQFIFAPVWGRISDHIGRRPILMLGLLGSVVFYSLFGIASELAASQPGLALALMFLSRIGAGIAGATIATAQAVIADTTTPEKRAHGMALIGIAFGIGFTFGPLVGFTSLYVPFPGAPGFAAAGLSLLALILAYRLLPETCKPGSVPPRRWLNWGGLYRAIQTPAVGSLILIFFLATFAFGGLESTLALVNRLLLTGEVQRDIRMTRETLMTSDIEKKNFLIFAYIGVVLMLVQGGIYRRMVRKVGEVRFMRLGVALMTVGLVGGVLVLLNRSQFDSVLPLVLVALGVFTLAVMGFAFLTPSVQALISRLSDPARQGEVLGVNQSASALARILGPFLSITLFFATPEHVLPYVFGAVLLAIVFILSLRITVQPSTAGERIHPHAEAQADAPGPA